MFQIADRQLLFTVIIMFARSEGRQFSRRPTTNIYNKFQENFYLSRACNCKNLPYTRSFADTEYQQLRSRSQNKRRRLRRVAIRNFRLRRCRLSDKARERQKKVTTMCDEKLTLPEDKRLSPVDSEVAENPTNPRRALESIGNDRERTYRLSENFSFLFFFFYFNRRAMATRAGFFSLLLLVLFAKRSFARAQRSQTPFDERDERPPVSYAFFSFYFYLFFFTQNSVLIAQQQVFTENRRTTDSYFRSRILAGRGVTRLIPVAVHIFPTSCSPHQAARRFGFRIEKETGAQPNASSGKHESGGE